jgi:hypothetical protein
MCPRHPGQYLRSKSLPPSVPFMVMIAVVTRKIQHAVQQIHRAAAPKCGLMYPLVLMKVRFALFHGTLTFSLHNFDPLARLIRSRCNPDSRVNVIICPCPCFYLVSVVAISAIYPKKGEIFVALWGTLTFFRVHTIQSEYPLDM